VGTVEALSISTGRGMVKEPVSEAEFITGHGISGDAHAGDWHRQVSLLPGESIDRMKESMPEIAQGAFAENIITRDLEQRSRPGGHPDRQGVSLRLRHPGSDRRMHHAGRRCFCPGHQGWRSQAG